MITDAIKNFPKQFEYEPTVENAAGLKSHRRFIVAGMGGSHLAADILKSLRPDLDIMIHSDYGLPKWNEHDLVESLVIASSYSGNTEETIDAFNTAREKNIPVVAIATGGKLLELAREYQAPFIQLPNTDIRPRMALGFSLRAMLLAMGEKGLLQETSQLAHTLKPEGFEGEGKALAQKLIGKVPLVYASARNKAIAMNWKIVFNETGKIPAFYNVFPELNHNEMTGFSTTGGSASGGDIHLDIENLSRNFACVMLLDPNDHPKIHRRMEILEKLYIDRGIPVHRVNLEGASHLEQIFSSILLATWTAIALADHYHVEAEQVPMVEEFKKLINQ